MPKLLNKDSVAEMLSISVATLDEERRKKRFPEPLICKLWSQAQIEDYVSQLETFGGWTEEQYFAAMEQRRVRLAG